MRYLIGEQRKRTWSRDVREPDVSPLRNRSESVDFRRKMRSLAEARIRGTTRIRAADATTPGATAADASRSEPLPPEIWEVVFRAASPSLLCNLRAGCRSWRDRLDSPETEWLWEAAYCSEWRAGERASDREDASSPWRYRFLARWWTHSRWGSRQPTVCTLMGKNAHGGTVTCVSLGECGDSGEGHALSASDDGSVFLWRFSPSVAANAQGNSGVSSQHAVAQQHHRQCRGDDVRCPQRVKQFYGQHGPVWCLWYDQQQELLLSGGSDATVKVWNPTSERCEATLRGHEGWVTCLGAMQAGRVLASGGSDGILKFWNLESRQCLSSYGPPGGNPKHSMSCLATVEAQGAVLTGHSFLRHLLRWDLETMQCRESFAGHEGDIYAIHAEGPSPMFVSGSKDRTVRVWDPRAPPDKCCVGVLRGHTGAVLDVKLRGNRAVSASMDKTVRMWDIRQSAAPLATLEGHSAEVHCVDFRDRMVLSGSRDTSLKVWTVV
ncbi:unnamed protein product [Polarella glacialis]|uniref:Guanine nucleotide-binding protein subunit beta-like protein n=1 Tax=Polarella glacialis TaxID=89957 RepID=A0A813ES89_POLGL|nr:unnamed protein product [Polarella glacialis]